MHFSPSVCQTDLFVDIWSRKLRSKIVMRAMGGGGGGKGMCTFLEGG